MILVCILIVLLYYGLFWGIGCSKNLFRRRLGTAALTNCMAISVKGFSQLLVIGISLLLYEVSVIRQEIMELYNYA